MNSDFKDLLSLLDRFSVRYLVVGGYAVMYHSEPRFTKDLDILVSIDDANLENFAEALAEFGFPLSESHRAAFSKPNSMIVLGRAPSRIDFLNQIPGVDFAEAWARRSQANLGEQIISFIGLEDLIASKKATGRPQDLIDVSHLERASEKDGR